MSDPIKAGQILRVKIYGKDGLSDEMISPSKQQELQRSPVNKKGACPKV